MEKYAIIINRIGIVLFLINFIVCIVTIKKIKQSKKSLIISMILVIVQFYGFMEGNFLLEDTAIPNTTETRIYAGNIIMTIAFIAQITNSLKLIISIIKYRKKEENPNV